MLDVLVGRAGRPELVELGAQLLLVGRDALFVGLRHLLAVREEGVDLHVDLVLDHLPQHSVERHREALQLRRLRIAADAVEDLVHLGRGDFNAALRLGPERIGVLRDDGRGILDESLAELGLRLHALVDDLADFLANPLHELLPAARSIGDGVLLGARKHLGDGAREDVAEFVGGQCVGVLLHDRVLRQHAALLRGHEVVRERAAAVGARRVVEPGHHRRVALVEDSVEDLDDRVIGKGFFRADVGEERQRDVRRLDGLLRIGLGMLEELALFRVEKSLHRKEHAVREALAHRLHLGLAEVRLVVVELVLPE